MIPYLSEHGKDINNIHTILMIVFNICPKCLGFWTQQNTKGVGLKVLKKEWNYTSTLSL